LSGFGLADRKNARATNVKKIRKETLRLMINNIYFLIRRLIWLRENPSQEKSLLVRFSAKVRPVLGLGAGALLFSWLCLSFVSCASLPIQSFKTDSRRLESPIVIDGKPDEWHGSLSFIQESQLLLGFRNDQHFLCACFVAESRQASTQILSRGLMVWFDPQGGTQKAFGIRYPLGISAEDRPFLMGEDEKIDEDFFKKTLKDLIIVRPGKNPTEKMSVEEAKARGLEVGITAEIGLVVYELKIPLTSGGDKIPALGVQPGATIGIGLELPETGFGRMRGMGGGMPGGGFGRPTMGGGYDPFGEETGGPFGTSPQIQRELKVWASVRLSSEEPVKPAALLRR
jgi:hypothetical protein